MTADEPHSALTARLIRQGLSPKPPLTEPQILLERIDAACQSGSTTAFRRRVLAECRAFVAATMPTRITDRRSA